MDYRVANHLTFLQNRTLIQLDDINNVKIELMKVITQIIEHHNLTQRQAAILLKVYQPKISQMKRLKITAFSLARLLAFLAILSCNVKLLINLNRHQGKIIKIQFGDIKNVKTELMNIINTLIKKHLLCQEKVAQMLKTNQARVSNIKNLRVEGFSLERIFLFLLRLNCNIELVITPTRKIQSNIKEIKDETL